MKIKTIALIAMSLLLALSMMTATAFAETTLATVAFVEGTLEFGDAGLDNMDIDFGTQPLPVGASTYAAVDGDHTLPVLDARSTAGDWHVNVALSAFESVTSGVTNTFNGTITMTAPTVSSGLTAVSPLTINSGAAATEVVRAALDLSNGTYSTTWLQANIELYIDGPDAATITEPASYEAVMTWTLADA